MKKSKYIFNLLFIAICGACTPLLVALLGSFYDAVEYNYFINLLVYTASIVIPSLLFYLIDRLVFKKDCFPYLVFLTVSYAGMFFGALGVTEVDEYTIWLEINGYFSNFIIVISFFVLIYLAIRRGKKDGE